ncbi:TPM domain-containing protein [Faunimonas sp. B44]|uniref:TPM domain-containing protein n=1 Tax=Faunimonas sp. B44 TaxID=3461493 RepID=UPI004043E46D
MQARAPAALLAILVTLAFLLAGAAAHAQTFPELSGRVVDAAGFLSPEDERALDALLADHEAKSRNQVVVATVPSLEGYPIEDYGVALGRHWGIGQKEADNGVILLVAPNERAVRIEVGYGLEPLLTDAVSRLIIEGSILPRFRAGDYAGGIRRGVEDILAVLGGDAEAYKARAEETAKTAQPEAGDTVTTILVIAMIVFWIVISNRTGRRGRRRGMVVPPMIGGWGGGRRGGGFGGGGGWSGGGGSFGGGGASGRW